MYSCPHFIDEKIRLRKIKKCTKKYTTSKVNGTSLMRKQRRQYGRQLWGYSVPTSFLLLLTNLKLLSFHSLHTTQVLVNTMNITSILLAIIFGERTQELAQMGKLPKFIEVEGI